MRREATEQEAAMNGIEYEGIHIDYPSLYDAVRTGRISDPVLIPAVFEVPTWEIMHYLEKIGAGDLNGHVDARVSEEKGMDRSAMDVMKIWMPIMIMALLVVCAIYLLFGSGVVASMVSASGYAETG